MKNIKRLILILVATLVVSSGLFVYSRYAGLKSDIPAGSNLEFSLVRPVFAQNTVMSAAATFLDQEAGMAMWLNTGSSLNLNAANNSMVNVENFTSDYVIGSLSDDGGISSSDDYPHCLVSGDGGIVVYYLKINLANPGTTGWIGKIIDWNGYANGQAPDNFLSEGMTYITGKLSMSASNAQYYHFQYPNAAKLLMAIKGAIGDGATATFNIYVPDTVTFYERSWSCTSTTSSNYVFMIDGNTINSTNYRHYGGPEITGSILYTSSWHTVKITANSHWPYAPANSAYVCLLLLYS